MWMVSKVSAEIIEKEADIGMVRKTESDDKIFSSHLDLSCCFRADDMEPQKCPRILKTRLIWILCLRSLSYKAGLQVLAAIL